MLLKKASGIIPGALILHNQRMVPVFKDKTNAVRHALERQDTLEIKGTQNEDNSITEGSIVFVYLGNSKVKDQMMNLLDLMFKSRKKARYNVRPHFILLLLYGTITYIICYGHGGNDMKDMWRRLPLKKKIVVLLTLLCIGLTIGYLPEPYPHVLTKEEIKEAESVSRSQTEVLAPNVSLIDQAGHTVSMQSLYNKKPVLLYFWMSWSDMAAKELPVLDDMYRQQGRDVYFVIVCLDRGDAARQRIESGWSYDMPLYFASMETAGTYNVYEVPQWIMIDRGGTIREKRTGSLDHQQLEYALARSLK